MNSRDIEARANQLITQIESAIRNARKTQPTMNPSMGETEWSAARTGSLSFLASIFGKNHTYYEEFQKQVSSDYKSDGETALGLLTAARDEIRGGWLQTTKGLISAEVFADFLEMAEHLLDEGYKDPAAVMAGSVLEEHLRQLCLSVNVPITFADAHGNIKHKKADAINADLTKASKYNNLDQKQVTAWLGIRNDAAHGNYDRYTKSQVDSMVSGITDFMTRVRP